MNSHYNGSQGFFTHPEKKNFIENSYFMFVFNDKSIFWCKKNII